MDTLANTDKVKNVLIKHPCIYLITYNLHSCNLINYKIITVHPVWNNLS